MARCIGFYAAASIGCIVVPLNGMWTGDELKYGLADSGTKVLIADVERYTRAAPYLLELGVVAVVAMKEEAAFQASPRPVPASPAVSTLRRAGPGGAALQALHRISTPQLG